LFAQLALVSFIALISLLEMYGKPLHSFNFHSNLSTISVADLATGLYLLNGEDWKKKILKINEFRIKRLLLPALIFRSKQPSFPFPFRAAL
jgi:hypothetical protein